MEIYAPEEDSYFLSEIIKQKISKIKEKSQIKFFEVGVGSGIQLETARESGISNSNISGVDINNNAIYLCREKGFNIKKSDLFHKIPKSQKFNLIVFNPPYLPEHKYDSFPDTTGGKNGDETIIEFLKQSKNHLEKNGKILLLTSSFTPKINFKQIGYTEKLMGEKKLFQEKLFVWELSCK